MIMYGEKIPDKNVVGGSAAVESHNNVNSISLHKCSHH